MEKLNANRESEFGNKEVKETTSMVFPVLICFHRAYLLPPHLYPSDLKFLLVSCNFVCLGAISCSACGLPLGLCSGIIPDKLEDNMGCQESKPCELHAKQMPCPLYHSSDPLLNYFVHRSQKDRYLIWQEEDCFRQSDITK